MKTKVFFISITAAILMLGCSDNNKFEEKPTVPFKLSGEITSINVDKTVIWTPLDIGETQTFEILSGNGGYKITPNIRTFCHSDLDTGEAVYEHFTISDDYVKAKIEGNKIIFERIALSDVPYGAYIISDSSGQAIEFLLVNPGVLGNM